VEWRREDRGLLAGGFLPEEISSKSWGILLSPLGQQKSSLGVVEKNPTVMRFE
jgi:hypothetical protein